MQMQYPRRLAAEALIRIERGGYSNLVLAGLLRDSGLSPRDRAFCSRLVYGVLERRRLLDARLSPFLKKPVDKLDAQVRAALRLGLYQQLYMDGVPNAAAVNESVKLVRALGKSSAAGLVNAVLRRAAGPWQPVFHSEAERLGVTCSVSDEIAALFMDAFGPQAGPLLEACFEPPALTVRVNALRTDPAALAARLKEEGVQAEPAWVPGSLQLYGAGEIAALPAFQQGLFHVQGLASQLAAAALDARPGQRVLDLCAAPGGKSATIAQAMQNTGQLFCCDAAASRLPLIEKLLARLGVTNAQVLRSDAAQPVPELQSMDRVLCDVPCSGLGVLAKKPDIRYKDLSDLPRLIETQRAILACGAEALRPGGRLVYSTCTVNPAENQAVVRGFLAHRRDYKLLPPPFALPEGALDDDGMITFLPGTARMDGFFVACLERLW